MSEFKQKLQKIIDSSKIDFELESPGFMNKTQETEFTSNDKTFQISQQDPFFSRNKLTKRLRNSINEEDIIDRNYQTANEKSPYFLKGKNFLYKSINSTIKRKIIPLNLDINVFSLSENSKNKNSNTERNVFESKYYKFSKNTYNSKNSNNNSKFITEIVNNNNKEHLFNYSMNNSNSKENHHYFLTEKNVFQQDRKYYEKSRNNNKIKNKILLMKEEFRDYSSQNTIINRPIRTLNSPLYQFNRESLNYFSPIIRVNKKIEITNAINKQVFLDKSLRNNLGYELKSNEKNGKKIIYVPKRKTIRYIWRNNNIDKLF